MKQRFTGFSAKEVVNGRVSGQCLKDVEEPASSGMA
jgi:hypothetical protein